MSSFRKRHSASAMKLNHDDASSVKDNALLGYSDDEDGAMTPAKDHRSVASVKTDATIPSDIAANFLTEGATRFSDGESDEMEEDLNIFNKTVQISDLDKINHATLLRKMHERFKRKADKWERLAYSFARYGFVMNFAILVLQLLQMILHQAASTWTLGYKDAPVENDKSLLQSMGWKKQPSNQTGLTWTDFLEAALSRQCLQTFTSDKYGESFLSSGMLDLWGSNPADVCTGNAFWGCSRTGSGTNYINPIQSARIRTAESFAFKYGRIIVNAKMPAGDWLWPAIWMLPRDNAYGGWPASGEIDIVESRGNANLKDGSESKGNDNAGMTLHWGPYWPLNGYSKTTVESHNDFAGSFHKYEVDWSENAIVFKIDGQTLKTISPSNGFWEYGQFDSEAPGSENPWQNSPNKMTPFDQEFYILINLAVGGTNGFFPDSWTNSPYPKPWVNTSPTAMKDFWMAKSNWYPTWNAEQNNGEDAALQVKSIEVWAN